jgi:hypothetical protein
MAQKHEALQKPWMYLSLGGILLTLLWLLPMGVLIRWLGSWPWAWVLVGLLILFYWVSLWVWGEITAVHTAQIFAAVISKDGSISADEPALAVLKAHGVDLLVYVLSLPGLTLVIVWQELFAGQAQSSSAWKKAHPLIPPIVALKDLHLKPAIEEVKTTIDENLLRFQPGYLPVAWVARGGAWIAILLGLLAGWLIAVRVANPLFTASWRSWIAVGIGLAAAGTLSLVGIAFSTYFRTCYHTALYAWALDLRAARDLPGEPGVAPPAILAQAMSKKPKNGSTHGNNDGKEESNATKT